MDMTSFWIKAITVPVALAIVAWLLPDVRYDAYYMPILVGVILAVVGMLMEYALLREGTLWLSTFADVVAAAFEPVRGSGSFLLRRRSRLAADRRAGVLHAPVAHPDRPGGEAGLRPGKADAGRIGDASQGSRCFGRTGWCAFFFFFRGTLQYTVHVNATVITKR
jgi:hypothetical protein